MKYEKTFPLYKSKNGKVFSNLADLEQKDSYYREKAGEKIQAIKNHLEHNTFIAYLLAKKTSGKGTYAKELVRLMGLDTIAHISVGDLVREAHNVIESGGQDAAQLRDYLVSHYRGRISIDSAIAALLGKDQQTLLPTEFTLVLLKKAIEENQGKSLLIDGFPRAQDQVSYALYFKDLIDFRSDPDVFVVIDAPDSVIRARMESRVVCPACGTPRSTRFLPTSKIGHDGQDFYLICDNADCEEEKMIGKIGDDAGFDSIAGRMQDDGNLMDEIMSIHGISKIYLRNTTKFDSKKELVDDYEITPEYVYSLDNEGNVSVDEKPWVIKDDEGVKVVNLLAPTVMLSFIDQLHDFLGLSENC